MCFIFFAILFSVPIVCKAQEPIIGEIVQENQLPTQTIEDMVKNILPSSNGVTYTIVPRGLIISVPTILLFEDRHRELKEGSEILLCKLGKIIKSLDNSCVVEGNSLKQEEFDMLSSLELSMIRAERIVEFLIKYCHVNPLKIRSIGFGDMMPFKDNVSYKGSMDKRIDFVIINYEWKR